MVSFFRLSKYQISYINPTSAKSPDLLSFQVGQSSPTDTLGKQVTLKAFGGESAPFIFSSSCSYIKSKAFWIIKDAGQADRQYERTGMLLPLAHGSQVKPL